MSIYEELAERVAEKKTLDELKESGFYLSEHPYAKRRYKVTHRYGWYKTDSLEAAEAFMQVMAATESKEKL